MAKDEQGGQQSKTASKTERRGFGSMDRAKQRELASKGGKAAHARGTAHEWTSDEARVAGRKGGQVSRGGRGKLPRPETGTEPPAPMKDPTATGLPT